MTQPKEDWLIIMQEKRTIEQRIKKLEVYVRIGFVMSAIFFGWALYETVESYNHRVEWEKTIDLYSNSVALADSANKLVIENQHRWKIEQDEKDALKAKQ